MSLPARTEAVWDLSPAPACVFLGSGALLGDADSSSIEPL